MLAFHSSTDTKALSTALGRLADDGGTVQPSVAVGPVAYGTVRLEAATIHIRTARAHGRRPRKRLTVGKFVSVVDDDESIRESLPELLRSFDLEVETFSSAQAFLESDNLRRTQCLVLDVVMPGMSGPELQQELLRRNVTIPIIFMSARSDERINSEVLKRGAVACLIKPFSEATIVASVHTALRAGGA